MPEHLPVPQLSATTPVLSHRIAHRQYHLDGIMYLIVRRDIHDVLEIIADNGGVITTRRISGGRLAPGWQLGRGYAGIHVPDPLFFRTAGQ